MLITSSEFRRLSFILVTMVNSVGTVSERGQINPER